MDADVVTADEDEVLDALDDLTVQTFTSDKNKPTFKHCATCQVFDGMSSYIASIPYSCGDEPSAT